MISATTLARSVIRQLLELGVSDFVLSPGSRNAPLSVALYEAYEAGMADLHIRIDERGAGFFALGIAKATNNYVVVICTSGTAAANYYPAALEAFHSGSKLIVITADRPARLRRTGANQTTEQQEMFGVLSSFDISEIVNLSLLVGNGPLHLNVQFDEPLLSDGKNDWLAGLKQFPFAPKVSHGEGLLLSGNGVVVVGHDRGGFSVAEVLTFTNTLGWPVIAEDPLSFPNAIAHASIFLADEEIRRSLPAKSVIVIGRTTLSRSINTYIQSAAKIIVVDPRVETVDTERTADLLFLSLPEITLAGGIDGTWLPKWKMTSALAAESFDLTRVWTEQTAINAIVRNLPEGCALFIGSSRPIRDVEAFAHPRSGISVFANRGLAGIDGNISTAMGIATRYERAYAIIGDLTFLHDVSALVNSPKINLTIFVIDNNGGGIFSTLPQAGVNGFERIFGTPHNQDLPRIARGFGIPTDQVKSLSDIEKIIAHQSKGIEIVIVEVPDRESNAANLKLLYQSASSAVRIGNNLD
ncbi:MAG: 2-succinyl-5-enolpyruvyl-6-hydroxy-3-cyclohexene-1-carboxylic-acid synthase [Actinomycetes bacterium]